MQKILLTSLTLLVASLCFADAPALAKKPPKSPVPQNPAKPPFLFHVAPNFIFPSKPSFYFGANRTGGFITKTRIKPSASIPISLQTDASPTRLIPQRARAVLPSLGNLPSDSVVYSETPFEGEASFNLLETAGDDYRLYTGYRGKIFGFEVFYGQLNSIETSFRAQFRAELDNSFSDPQPTSQDPNAALEYINVAGKYRDRVASYGVDLVVGADFFRPGLLVYGKLGLHV